MEMPKLTPLPIKTKSKSFFARIWVWMTEVRAWKVVEDWEYDLPDGRKIIIPQDFVFDGASIPRPLWGLLSPTGLLLIPGLIHDFGYRFDYIWIYHSNGYVYKSQENSGQKYWDKLFYEVGKYVNGMKVINFLAWLALFSMGFLAWKSNRKKGETEILPNKKIQPVTETSTD